MSKCQSFAIYLLYQVLPYTAPSYILSLVFLKTLRDATLANLEVWCYCLVDIMI